MPSKMASKIANKKANKKPKNLLNDVLNMASSVPAKLLDLQEHGRLESGLRADFVLLNQDLSAQATWINGAQVSGSLQDKQ